MFDDSKNQLLYESCEKVGLSVMFHIDQRQNMVEPGMARVVYANMPGTVVVNVLNRDRTYASEFIIRNQDKLLWATDEGWWEFYEFPGGTIGSP